MEQHHLRLELKLSSPHSYDRSILHGNSASPQPGIQIEERDSVAFYPEPGNQSQDDYPDGGLRAWLVVLGVRLPAFLPLWTVSDHVLGCLYLFFNVGDLWHTACSYKVLIAARRGGYVNSRGVSRYYIVPRMLILSCYFHQVFQDYYENHLLKGTSPSTMCVLTIFSTPLSSHLMDIIV